MRVLAKGEQRLMANHSAYMVLTPMLPSFPGQRHWPVPCQRQLDATPAERVSSLDSTLIQSAHGPSIRLSRHALLRLIMYSYQNNAPSSQLDCHGMSKAYHHLKRYSRELETDHVLRGLLVLK